MKDLALHIGCDVVLKIKNGRFFIVKNWDDVGMTEVNIEEFKENLKGYANVCSKTWSKRLKDDYKEICKEVGLVIKSA